MIIKTSIRQIAESKNIKIINKVKNGTHAEIDEDIMGFVVRNLLTNAVKFSYENSEVIISEKIENEILSLYVKDSGVGISENNLQKLFKIDENYTQKGTNNEYGSGLGLILCKEFINLHNGSLSVESELKKGSEFKISIPLQNPQKSSK
jgi:signal transduction histidine kinase